MPVSVEKMHRNDHSIGEIHVPSSPLFELAYNIENMKLGKMELGSKKWWNFIAKVIHQLEYADLDHVFNGRFLPQFIADRLDPEYRKWATSRMQARNERREGQSLQYNRRIIRAMQVLMDAPLGQLAFATVVASFEGTEEEAIAEAEKQAKRLGQFIRRRFKDAVSLMFPEVDLKVAKDVSASLLPTVGWKLRFDPKQRIFKIHFHGLIYVPGYSPSDIEQAFKRTANGKRSRLYSGANQVRVIPVEEAPGFNDGTPDVEGIAGYSNKYVYNPPVKARMFEGLASWLLVTDAILKNSKTIVVTGVRAGVRMAEESRDADVREPVRTSEYDRIPVLGDSMKLSLGVSRDAKVNQSHFPVSGSPEASSDWDSILYSVDPSIWQDDQKQAQKKILDWVTDDDICDPLSCQMARLSQGP